MLALFVGWELASTHPMLNVQFFRRRRFSAAVSPAGREPMTNGAFLQVGGALGVAVIGSLLNTRYQDKMISTLASHHIPHGILQTILGSIGGALAVADRVGGFLGAELGQLARSAFISGMGLGLATGAGVAAAGCVIALLALPSRVQHHQEGRPDGRSPGGPGHGSPNPMTGS